MKLCQLTENLLPGDAISDEVLSIDRLLRAWGMETELFCAHVCRPTPGITPRDPAELAALLRPEDVLLCQYSIGSPLTALFRAVNCRRAVVYQNITPARFLRAYAPHLADRALRGRTELRELIGELDFALASSSYSAAELKRLGMERVDVLPVLYDPAPLRGKPDAALLGKLRDGKKNILFVGRKAPNKCIEDVMLAADYYAAAYGTDCRLILAGDTGLQRYCERLLALRKRLKVEIVWLGRVSQAELNACYAAADLFLCLSEHEGFCVPLLESMLTGVPILAFASTAVPETLGSGGVLTEDKHFETLAPLMHSLLTDETERQRVIKEGYHRAAELSPERVGETLRQLITKYI